MEEDQGNNQDEDNILDEINRSQINREQQRQPHLLNESRNINQSTSMLGYKSTVQQIWKPFDFLFPAGKLAKLVRIYDNKAKIPYNDILNKLKLNEGYPVINIIGAKEAGRGKFYAGIARAAFNTDSVVIDSGIQSGIEKYAIRRGIKLIGVAPENAIKFPKINPTQIDPIELSNGHTHLFLISSPEEELQWTQEALFKIELGLKISQGSTTNKKKLKCRVVHVLMANSHNYVDEVRLAVARDQAIIVVKGSPVCDDINSFLIKQQQKRQEQAQQNLQGQAQQNPKGGTPKVGTSNGQDLQNSQGVAQQNLKGQAQQNPPVQAQQNPPVQEAVDEELNIDPDILQLLPTGNFFVLDSEDSEDIAQYLHFLLTVSPWDSAEDKEAKRRAREGIDRTDLYVPGK